MKKTIVATRKTMQSKTYFDQVPLAVVKKIAKAESRKTGTIEPNPPFREPSRRTTRAGSRAL